MSALAFLRSRQWVLLRRLALIAIVLILAFRNYGGTLSSWLSGLDRDHDVVITKEEFRPDLDDAKPAWIIGLKNESNKITYEQIELEATYWDRDGKVLETDKLLVRQKLVPGDEQLVARIDSKNRPGATSGRLRVVGAKSVTP